MYCKHYLLLYVYYLQIVLDIDIKHRYRVGDKVIDKHRYKVGDKHKDKHKDKHIYLVVTV